MIQSSLDKPNYNSIKIAIYCIFVDFEEHCENGSTQFSNTLIGGSGSIYLL
jgi:hypothetical protein